ncbi:hypothetical protein PhiCh1p51 [Natrialba phage PhiCh1]|uniref:Uncharacterized protein n=1 Tax=Natrialba phage PhiCh1 TaxID=114777 RepID=Q8JL06_9CAUD|nr:hypothetical protein PhiCh1p51 [Natrialba phage PhiCh1]AAM88724.1 unknown [Natrialba phage PhiCh1]
MDASCSWNSPASRPAASARTPVTRWPGSFECSDQGSKISRHRFVGASDASRTTTSCSAGNCARSVRPVEASSCGFVSLGVVVAAIGPRAHREPATPGKDDTPARHSDASHRGANVITMGQEQESVQPLRFLPALIFREPCVQAF